MLLEERRCFTLFFFCNFAESTPYNLLRLSMGYKVGKRERVMEEKVLFVRSDGFVIEKSEKNEVEKQLSTRSLFRLLSYLSRRPRQTLRLGREDAERLQRAASLGPRGVR